MTPAESWPDDATVERVAEAIFASRGFYGADPEKPTWVPRGNSTRQGDARDLARAALSATPAPGDGPGLERAASLLEDAIKDLLDVRQGVLHALNKSRALASRGGA